MKSLKLLAVALSLSAILATESSAQEKTHNNGAKKHDLKEMRQKQLAKLEMSAEQKVKFTAISKKYAEQMKATKEPEEVRLARMKQLKLIQEQKNAEIKNLLSENQYKMYLEMQAETRKKFMKNKVE